MNSGIDEIRYIDENALKSDDYFKTLADEACKCGLLDGFDIERIQTQLIELLGGICVLQTEKGNSSMKIEDAEEISKSVMYTVSVRLKTQLTPEKGVKLLKDEPIEKLFEEGKGEISKLLTRARGKWAVITKQLFETKNCFYRSTIADGMKAFFQNYDCLTAAHKNIITCDYPLYLDGRKENGVEFICSYLEKFACENSFCLLFKSEKVHRLMCSLDKFLKLGDFDFSKEIYCDIPVNIFEYVLSSSLGLELVGRSPLELDLTEAEVREIQKMLCRKDYGNIVRTLDAAAGKLCFDIGADESVRDYVRKSVRKLAHEVASGGKNAVSASFLSINDGIEVESVNFTNISKMSDSEFRFLAKQLSLCDSSEKKIALIGETVKSADDFADIAENAKLQKEEISACLQNLELSQIMLLLKNYLSFQNRLSDKHESLSDVLKDYVMSLQSPKKELVLKLLSLSK